MPLQPSQALAELKKGEFAPLYFLHGDEPYFIDQVCDYIEEHALAPAEKDFNLVVLYGKECDMATVLGHAKRFPMMAQRQVVIVKEAKEIKDIGKESGRNQLLSYTENPVPTTLLVFAYKHGQLNGNLKLTKLLDKKAKLVQSKKMYDNKLPDWLSALASEQGFSITPKATHMIISNVGNDLQRIYNEIEKVRINKKDNESINDADIEQFCGISKDFNIFELQKAIGIKDRVKALQIMLYFIANPKANPSLVIIAALFAYFSKLLILHHSSDRSPKSLAQSLQVNPYFVRDYLTASRNYNLPQVIKIIQALQVADLQSKGINSASSYHDGEILRELLIKIMI